MLQEKAKDFATKLKIQSFAASNGWLEGFTKWHHISFCQICGEAKAVDDGVGSDWLKNLSDILQHYNDADIYNAEKLHFF